MNYLLISGSPRKGNTDYILGKLSRMLKGRVEFVQLRTKNIKHCVGCLYCDEHKACSIKDDMQALYPKIESADVIILGTPNYFDNVNGLTKDFIDRTNPFYETDKLKNKKIVFVVVGGGSIKNSNKVINGALKSFSDCHKLKVVGKYCFKALRIGDIEKDKSLNAKLKNIVSKINK